MRAGYSAGQLMTPKSGKVRAVPMAPDVGSALARLGAREDWVGDDDVVFAGKAGGVALTDRRFGGDTERYSPRLGCAACVSAICATPSGRG